MFLKYVFFLCSSLMRIFVVKISFIFRTVCGHLDLFFVALSLNSTGLAIVAEAYLCSGVFCAKKIVITVLAVFFSFWP